MNKEKFQDVLIIFLLIILFLALLSKVVVHCNKKTETEIQRNELSDSTLIKFSNNFIIEDLGK